MAARVLFLLGCCATGAAAARAAATASVELLAFNADGTEFGWTALVDPVMGGESYATATVSEEGQYGILDGEVKIVPKLQAPGFITAYTEGRFPDASSAWDGDLVLNIRSSTPEFKGFKVSFAAGSLFPKFSCAAGGKLPGSRGCYKANFAVPPGDDFVDVRIPLNTFSDLWSSYTGEQETTCAEDHAACPTARVLQRIQRVEIWGEGSLGMVHIEVKSIRMETLKVLPSSMLAAAILNERGLYTDDFDLLTLPVPLPASREALVRVAGSSVNPCEWKQLGSNIFFNITYPLVSGKDISGTIVAVGPGSGHRLSVGDTVWGLSGWDGAHAEYATVSIDSLAVAPTSISLAEAGVMPLVGLTNLQGFEIAGAPFRHWDTVVVLGGSSGSGHLAIQMAKMFGAKRVVTTCSARNTAFCTAQGADLVVDYHTKDWRDFVERGSVDFVYDTVAQVGTGDVAFDVIRDGGWFVTLLSHALASPEAIDARQGLVHQAFFMLNQTGPISLNALKGLVDAGGLRAHIEQSYDLSEVGLAFNASRAGHIVGKVSVAPAAKVSAVRLTFFFASTFGCMAVSIVLLSCFFIARRRAASKLNKLPPSVDETLSSSLRTIA